MRPKFPYFLVSEKKQRIDLSEVSSALVAIHVVGYYVQKQRAVPAIVFTVKDAQTTSFAVPLPFGRRMEDPEVRSFVQALNAEILKRGSSKKENLA